jgi:hypothetical protein
MASFTPNKGLAQPTVGADVGQWGTELNSSMSILDNNLGGVAPVSLAGASGIVVATTGNAQCLVQNFTGALAGNVTYQVPALGGMYICENNTTGAFTITVETTASGSLGTIIPQGTTVAVFSDGVNVSAQTTPNPGTFSNLTVSGTLGVAGAVTFSAPATSSTAYISTGTDAGGNGFNFRATASGYGAGLRNDGTSAYLLQTANGSPLGTFNAFRPFQWNLSTGVVTIDQTGLGINAGGAFHATGVISTAAGITAALSIAATGALSGSSVTSGSSVAATTAVTGATVTGSTSVTGGAWNLNAGSITSTLATPVIIGGTSGFAFNNHANTATNLSWNDAGVITTRTDLHVTGTMTAGNVATSGAYETTGSLLTFIGGATGVNFANATDAANNVSWDNSGNTLIAGNLTATVGPITSGNSVIVGGTGGFSCKLGTSGGVQANVFNLQWNASSNGIQTWIDATPIAFLANTSDARVKDQIQSLDEDFIGKIRALGVVSFRYKNIGIFRDTGRRHVGFVAQEVQKIIPDAVCGEPDAAYENGDIIPQSLNAIPLIAMNTGAIQQLLARVETLEAALKDRHSMYQTGLPEWPARTMFSWRERLMAKLRRLLKRWRGTPDA